MSNIFSGLSEVKEMHTDQTKEFNQLLNIKVATELTKFHAPILATIMQDSNEDLKETLKEEIQPGQGISLEGDDAQKLLRANILDRENRRIFFVDMSPNDEEGLEKIAQQTYDSLHEYVQDPILVMQNVKEDLQQNAI